MTLLPLHSSVRLSDPMYFSRVSIKYEVNACQKIVPVVMHNLSGYNLTTARQSPVRRVGMPALTPITPVIWRWSPTTAHAVRLPLISLNSVTMRLSHVQPVGTQASMLTTPVRRHLPSRGMMLYVDSMPNTERDHYGRY